MQNTCTGTNTICKYNELKQDVVNNWILSPGVTIGKG
jgi:hypothetical protein